LTTASGETAAPSPSAITPSSSDASIQPGPSPGTDAAPAPSSGADAKPTPVVDPGKSDHENLLSVVQDVVKDVPKDDEPVPKKADAEAPATAKTDDTQGKDTLPDPTPEELAKLTPNARQRIEGLIRQRKQIEAQLASQQPAVEAYQRLETYVTANKLSSQEVSDGLALMAALKAGEFQTFYDGVMPLVRVAAEAIGESLPDDLYEKVEAGTLPEDEAKEIAKLRAKTTHLEGVTKDTEAEREAQGVQQRAIAVREAIASYEAGLRTRDPDFVAKQPFMQHVAASFLSKKGLPKNPEEGIQMAKDVYAEVTRMFDEFRPKQQPTAKVPNGGGSSSTQVAAPGSLQEAVSQAIARSRSGF
jgi:hypothetical protein